MVELGIAIYLILAGGLVYGGRQFVLNRRAAKTALRARWSAQMIPHVNVTEVVVRRAGTACVLTTVQNRDPDFDTKLHNAMAEARMNASARNSELPSERRRRAR